MQVQARGRSAPSTPATAGRSSPATGGTYGRPSPPATGMYSSGTYGAGSGRANSGGTTYGGASTGGSRGADRAARPGNRSPHSGGPPGRRGSRPTSSDEPPAAGTSAPQGRGRSPLWARLTIILGALLVLASGGAMVGTNVLIGRYTDGIAQENLLGAAGKAAQSGKTLKGPINILLLGVDERSRNPGDVRSDTIIVLHIPASHDQAYLVSVPRDTLVDVPEFKPSRYPGGRSKITDAFHAGAQNGAGRAGGAQLVATIIKQMTGIEFDGAAIIDFRGFKRVIDALGGVDMCVDHEVRSQHMRMVDGKPMWLSEAREHGGGKPVVHKKGCHRMAGWAALDYSRQRYGLPRGDYDRQRHQQQLLKAMAKEAMSTGVVTDLGKLDRVIKAAGKAFILDTGGVPVADFALTLKGVAANDLVLVKTNEGVFKSARTEGISAERLSPESLAMFAAVRDGTLAEWLIAHPTYVAKEK